MGKEEVGCLESFQGVLESGWDIASRCALVCENECRCVSVSWHVCESSCKCVGVVASVCKCELSSV